jgi:hypothetical protein
MAEERKRTKPVKKVKRDRSRSPKRAAEEEVQVCKAVYTPTKHAVVSAFTTNPGQLRSFLNVPKAVLVQFPLKFVDNRGQASSQSEDDAQCLGVPPQVEPRVGLEFECVDASLSCMVFGHLQMQIYISPDATEKDRCATVDIAQLADHVAVRDLDEPIEIFRFSGDSSLRMASHTSSSANNLTIATLDNGDPSKTSFALKTLRMQYRVEIETAKLDKVAKIAALCNDTKWVRIDVYEAGPGDHCLLFKLKGDVGSSCELVYKSVAHAPHESNVVCFSIVGETVGPSVPDDEDRSRYKQVYCDYFDVKHLRAFVKGVLSTTIVILIPAKEGDPLVLTSMFGDSVNGAVGLSFVSQVQAPQVKEPNDDRACDFFAASR